LSLVTSYRCVLLGDDAEGTDVSDAHTATIFRTEPPIFQPHDTNFSKLRLCPGMTAEAELEALAEL
jgi:hypothetical protein